MKSKITKIQKILMKGIAVLATGMMLASPMVYATTSLDDAYLESSWWEQVLYGKIGSTAKEIEEYLVDHTTLYITNETQLRALAEYVNSGNSCQGKQIILLNDIELDSENEWVPIGNSDSAAFSGIFNGNNYTISGLKFNRGNKLHSEIKYVGLFGNVSNATIKNVTIDDSEIIVEPDINKDTIYNHETGGSHFTFPSFVGGIAGYIGDETSILYCTVGSRVFITGTEKVGGIAGYSDQVNGNNDAIIMKCINKGQVKGYRDVGGILGICASHLKIQSCINEGYISGYYSIGGIIGAVIGNKPLNVEFCKNNGPIIGSEDIIKEFKDQFAGIPDKETTIFGGGIIGYISNSNIDGYIKNCTNTGNISGFDQYAGGIVGLNMEIDVLECLNEGFIEEATVNFGVPEKYIGNYIGLNSNENLNEDSIVGSGCGDLSLGSNNSIEVTLDENKGLTVTYEIQDGYYKSGDTIKITATYNKKLYTSLGTSNTQVNKETAPKLTMKIDETAVEFDTSSVTISGNNTIVTYTKTVTDDMINGKAKELNLKGTTTYYAIEGSIPTDITTYPNYRISSINKTIDLSNNNIIVDTVKPTINTKVYVENALETERYTAGKEILFEVTTSETIQGLYEVPQIQVSFSESGIGKYNYTKEDEKVGYAKCKDAKINLDGTTTWTYSYQIQEFDEGYVSIEYTAGIITDLAGNETILLDTYKAEKADKTNLKKDGINITKVEVLKNDKTTLVTTNEYISENIYVRVYVDPINLYSDINTKMTTKTAPNLYLNGNIKQSDITNIDFTNGYIEYEYNTKNLVKLVEISMVSLINKVDLYEENQLISNAIPVGAQTDFEIEKFYLDGINFITKESEIYADTTAPTVEIIPVDVNNAITNKDTITYTFKFSEEVTDFKDEDITVNNGIKGILSDAIKDEEGKYIYTIDIRSNVSDGNVGNLQVIIEKDACQDLVGHGNVRTENVIKIDRIAPILLSLEAYANNTDSSIKVDESVDTVKEYYKVGDIVKVVATFSENIENTTTVPTLALQFSESGNSKVSVTLEKKSANKITYTYTITAEDMGILSVKGFSGTVLDAAGNETIVTKRNLNGDTIIADTKAPTLVGITAIATNFEYDGLLQAGETKRYGVQSKTRTENTIKIIAEYSENVYNLISNKINKITDKTTAPTLALKFSESGNAKGEVDFEKVEGSKIYYTYNIASGDNGDLSIVSLSGTVSDIAGNTLTTDANTKLEKIKYYEESIAEENEVNNITADTTNPTFTITATAENYDDNKNVITGNGSYYRKGTIITVTAKTSEYVYKNSNKELTRFAENGSDAPQLNISFSTSGNGVGTCTSVEYTNNQTIFTYTYEVKENDNGTLNLNIVESQGYDIALNGNSNKTQSISSIIADTVRPYYADQPGIEYVNGGYKVTFNENLYYLNESNVVTSFGDTKQAPLLKFEGQETVYEPSISGNFITYAGEYINAKPYLGASRLCDKAGNLYSYYDQEAPKLLKIEVTSPETGTYKAGQEITIVTEFNEKVTGTAPTLMIVFGDGETRTATINQESIKDNTIEYKYIIQNGDNGSLAIIDYNGTGLTDLDNNKWVKPENLPTLTGKTITAYTKAPTVIITSDVEKTNKEVVTYTFKWSELVTKFTAEGIEVTNGSKGAFKATDEDKNGYATEYTLEVDTTNEGRQIIKVNAGVCEDIAGNENLERVSYNKVVIDYTKPVIRAKVNGGNYVLDNTDPENKKSTLKETIVIDEELSSLQYVWSSSETIPEAGWVSEDVSTILVNSDINLTKEVKETGTYYLYIKATDIAGNILSTRTKAFVVKTSQIKLIPDKTDITNQDVTVTVKYGEGLTENRKAGVSGLTQSADSSKVIITENGTVYAEATDKAGNKVCKVLEIENIDKTAPEGTITYVTNEDKSVTATISFNEENVTITNNNGESSYVFEENGEFIFEFRDVAGNKGTMVAIVDNIVPEDTTAPTIVFNYTLTTTTIGNSIGATITTDEDAIISYSWDNKTWITSKEYIRSVNAINSPTEEGTYILYAKAKDRTENESNQTLEFTVISAIEEVKVPEIIFEDLPIIQVDGIKYVKVSADMTAENVTNKMDKNALCEATPEYTKLTSDNKLKTGSEITINDETKYVIVVNGDVDCDGKVERIDVTYANRIRLNQIPSAKITQKLAADFDTNGVIERLDITMINRHRLGTIKGI